MNTIIIFMKEIIKFVTILLLIVTLFAFKLKSETNQTDKDKLLLELLTL
jgi:hypothetical protein